MKLFPLSPLRVLIGSIDVDWFIFGILLLGIRPFNIKANREGSYRVISAVHSEVRGGNSAMSRERDGKIARLREAVLTHVPDIYTSTFLTVMV
jgi:hypothetical protein